MNDVEFIAISHENELVKQFSEKPEIKAYLQQIEAKKAAGIDIKHVDVDDIDPGVNLSDYVQATHPLTGSSLPVYATTYVHGDYGTGAIMGVPTEDDRDFAFAKKNNLGEFTKFEKSVE